eukprot:TRINITY_DN7962_c0_g5_i1.p1 TRINITY_DN7962_c0_g5~~TRINITY_DN7962_c0_g5_i1.p1  ORF type:complete len:1313 (-),score=172.15 TRINITY_DN7962_c0_g5_i1:177-4115(-)
MPPNKKKIPKAAAKKKEPKLVPDVENAEPDLHASAQDAEVNLDSSAVPILDSSACASPDHNSARNTQQYDLANDLEEVAVVLPVETGTDAHDIPQPEEKPADDIVSESTRSSPVKEAEGSSRLLSQTQRRVTQLVRFEHVDENADSVDNIIKTSTMVTHVRTEEHTINELLRDVCVKPYGVLGLQQTWDGHEVKNAERPSPTDIFLDPVGLHLCGGSDFEKTTVSELLHGQTCLDKDGYETRSPPEGATLHQYEKSHSVYMGRVDFRHWKGSKMEATQHLSLMYYAALDEFIKAFGVLPNLSTLRLTPLAGGVLAGPFADDHADMTWAALRAAITSLTGEQTAILRVAEVDMCIFEEEEFRYYMQAFEKVTAFVVTERELVYADAHFRMHSAAFIPHSKTFVTVKEACPVKLLENHIGGEGLFHYFELLSLYMKLCVMAIILTVPYLFGNFSGDSMEAIMLMAGGFTTRGTLANMGTLEDNRRVWEIDLRLCTLIVSSLDACGALFIYLVNWWLKKMFIPQMKAGHRRSEAFAIYVDNLPRRLKDDDQKQYEHNLRRHFENLLRASIPVDGPGTVERKLKVVRVGDNGEQELGPRRRGLLCCPRRNTGRDEKGRHVGVLNGIEEGVAEIQWRRLLGEEKPRPPQDHDPSLLLDHVQLKALEELGSAYSERDPKLPVIQQVCLIRDYNQKLAKTMEEFRNLTVKREHEKDAVKRRKLEKKLTTIELAENDEQRDVIGAFITFTYRKDRDFIMNEFRLSRTFFRFLQNPRMMFDGCHFRVSEAPRPSDIFWDNLDFPPRERFKRKGVRLLTCLLLLLACVAFVGMAQAEGRKALKNVQEACMVHGMNSTKCKCVQIGILNVYNDQPPGAHAMCKETLDDQMYARGLKTGAVALASVVNSVMNQIIYMMGYYWKPTSLTALNDSIFDMTALLQIINPVTIIVAVSLKVGLPPLPGIFAEYFPFGNGDYHGLEQRWYVDVGDALLISFLINCISIPLGGLLQPLMQCIEIKLCKRRKRTRTELLELFTPSEFQYATRSAQTASVVFQCTVLAAALPALWIALFVYLALSYWIDSYVLLHYSRKPPDYDCHIARENSDLVRWAVLGHTVFGILVFGHSEVAWSYGFSFTSWTLSSDTDVLGLERVSTWPQVVVGVIIMLHLLFTVIRFLLRVFFSPTMVTLAHMLRNWRKKRTIPWCIAIVGRFLGCIRALMLDMIAALVGARFVLRKGEDDVTVSPFPELLKKGIVQRYDISEHPNYSFLKGNKINDSTAERAKVIKHKVKRMALLKIKAAALIHAERMKKGSARLAQGDVVLDTE